DAMIESRVQDLMGRGMSPSAAQAEALRRFAADVDTTRRQLHRSAARRERRLRVRDLLENVASDIRYAIPRLRLGPGFAVTAIVTLALGIGANAAMFGIVDRLLFRSPAYLVAPDRVHRLYFARRSADASEFANNHTQFARYRDISRTSRTIEVAAAYSRREIAVGRGEPTRELPVGVTTATLWRLFSAMPTIGRFCTDA